MTQEPIHCASVDRFGLREWWQCPNPECGACYDICKPGDLEKLRRVAMWCCQVPERDGWVDRLIADAEAA